MPEKAIPWVDLPMNTKERHILVNDELRIPGLRMFGHYNTGQAMPALPVHYHPNCFEFTYCVHGNIRFFIDSHSYALSGGTLLVTFPNEVHDTGSRPMSLHQIYWFQLEADIPKDFLFMAPDAAHALTQRLLALPSRVVQMDIDETVSMLSQIYHCFCSSDPFLRAQGAQLLGVFLYQVVEGAERTGFRLTPDIGLATDYILSHIQEELPLETLARVSLLSVSRFKQKFKSQMGTSPRNFINYHKVELAKQLLAEGHSVTDVAMELNFSSSSYFSSVFRRYTSFAPSQYVLQEDPSQEL